MKETRLIEILRTFSEVEIKSFGKFLQSNLTVSRRNVQSFLKLLQKFHPQYDSLEFTNENIFKKLFTGEKYNPRKLSNYIYDLTKEAESFLKHTALDKNETESLMLLCKEFYERKLFDSALRQINQIEKIIQPEISMDRDLFMKIRMLEEMKINIYTEAEKIPNAIRSRHKFDESVVIQFMIDFIWMMGEQSHLEFNNFKSRQEDVFERIKECIDMDKFVSNVHDFGILNSSVVSFYYYIFKITKEPDVESNYFGLKKIFLANLKHLEHYEKFIILFYLIKFAINLSNKGNSKFRNETLDNYLLMLDLNAYAPRPDEFLQATDFRNILHFSPESGKAEFIESLINNNISKLNQEESEDIRNYSYAYLYFHKKDFHSSLEYLSKVRNIHKVFIIDVRLMKLKLFYELNYLEECISAIDALKHFIDKNNETPETVKEQMRMFIKAYSVLISIKAGNKKANAEIFRKEFQKSGLLYNRTWITEKTDELIELYKKNRR